MLSRLANPSSWPIAGKLALAFFFAAVVPIFLTAYYGMQETLSRVSTQERNELTEQSDASAQRIDRAVVNAKKTLDLLQQPLFLARLSDAPPKSKRSAPSGGIEAPDLLLRYMAANRDIELILIIDRKSRVVEASSRDYIGRDYAKRQAVQDALRGRRHVSGLEVDPDTRQQVLQLSMPLRDADGGVIGAALIKLTASAIEFALADGRRRSTVMPMLIDADGVLVWHPDAAMRYRPLVPLDDATRARIKRDRRYGDAALTPLELPDLALAWQQLAQPVQTEFSWTPSGESMAAALARVPSAPLAVVLVEPKSRWESPLREVFMSVFVKVFAVTLIAGLMAFAFFMRDVIRPIRQLTRAARAVKEGSLDVRARVLNDDEVGDLARTFNGMVSEIIERQRERDVFGRVVAPEVREKLLAGQLKLGGENRHVSVLFSDIRSFTTLCEGMAPEKVVEMLNEFLTEMTEAVKGHGGHVNNFLGDAIIVVFGAPDDHADPAWGAVQAAFDMRGRLESLNERRRQRGDAEIVSGIGIGTGTVVAGQMGSLERFVYTVVGDAVNVASRLENLTKSFEGNPILVNGETAAALGGRDGLSVTALGKHLVKGRTQEIDVFRVDWTLFE